MRIFPAWRKAATVLGLACLSTFAFADERSDKVDKLFASWDSTKTPGAALAVIKDGAIIYERGYGMAKLEDGIVMTPDKVFDLGSVSKQFTAACVAILIREGKIGLDDDIRKHLPEMPVYERPITIRHLLHHTSGLRDYNSLLDLAGFRPDADCPTVEEAYRVITLQKKLNYLPGEEYSYTNTGYFLLSQIVERTSGKSLNAFAQEKIFKPLGMAHTLYQDDHTQLIPDRATGYSKAGRTYKINMSNWNETGDGNVYTTAGDLYLWDQAFYTHALGKDLMDMLHTTGILNNGKSIDYAFGLVVDEYKGLKVVKHGGAWVGFRAALVRFPDQKFSVICLANLDSMNPDSLCFRVADIYLAGLLKDPAKKEAEGKKTAPFAVTQRELEEVSGSYQDGKFGIWITVSAKDNRLALMAFGQEIRFDPSGPSVFESVGGPARMTLELLPPAPGKVRQARLSIDGEERFLLDKAPALRPLTTAELQRYAGRYASEELLGAVYSFTAENGGLYLKTRTVLREALKAMAPDKFQGPGFSLEFVRGKGGRMTSLKLSAGRAAGIEFRKIS